MVFWLFSVETSYYLLGVMGDYILSLRYRQCLDCPTALGPQCLWHMLLGNNISSWSSASWATEGTLPSSRGACPSPQPPAGRQVALAPKLGYLLFLLVSASIWCGYSLSPWSSIWLFTVGLLVGRLHLDPLSSEKGRLLRGKQPLTDLWKAEFPSLPLSSGLASHSVNF